MVSKFSKFKSKLHSPTHSKSSAFMWGLIVGIIVSVAIWLLIFLLHKKSDGKKAGEVCKANIDCGNKLFCSGDKTCQAGVHGQSKGGICTTSKECNLGLECDSGKCETPKA